MRKSTCIAAAVTCALIGLAATTAKATLLPVNTSIAPNAQSDPLDGTTQLTATPVEPFNVTLNGSTMVGTMQEFVVTNYTGNIFGAANVTFVIQVSLTSGTSFSGTGAIIERITDSGFTGFPNDAGYHAQGPVGTTLNPSSADRSANGDVVGFNFLPPSPQLAVGGTTSQLIINTATTTFRPSVVGISGTLATSLNGYGSVPEPGSLAVCGIAGVGLLARKRRESAGV